MSNARNNDDVNPFYAARRRCSPNPEKPLLASLTYARLPATPQTSSPVPHLTSLYHFHRAGDYGDRRYPGNCGGNLIKDLLTFFEARHVFDPMSGGGTCRDVCREMGLAHWSGDIHAGFDLCDPVHFHGETRLFAEHSFDFAWIHPPYWRMKLYADDPRDLSRAPTMEAFLERYALAIAHCAHVLAPGGKLAILMGDYTDRAAGFVPLTWHTKTLAFSAGLRQVCTDIVRFSHGASSGKKTYRRSFIPGLHDICAIFEKPSNPDEVRHE